jgi:hypothetical protein
LLESWPSLSSGFIVWGTALRAKWALLSLKKKRAPYMQRCLCTHV